MDTRKLISINLRRLRVERGLSQENLAVDAEIDRTYVSRLERNMENPTVTVLERLAMALGVEITDLFAKIDPSAPPPQPMRSGRKAKGIR